MSQFSKERSSKLLRPLRLSLVLKQEVLQFVGCWDDDLHGTDPMRTRTRTCQIYNVKKHSFVVMAHYDMRVEWIRQRVRACFNLTENKCFDELLSRRDGKEEEELIRYLNVVSEENTVSCLLFIKTVREEEIDVQIPQGKLHFFPQNYFNVLLNIHNLMLPLHQ